MRGTWRSTHIKEGTSEKKADDSFQFAFAPGGTLETVIYTTLGNVANRGTYSLDGKNIKTTGPFGTMRVEGATTSTLELFSYDMTTTYYLTRR